MQKIKKIIVCGLVLLPMCALAYPVYSPGFNNPNISVNDGPLAALMDNVYEMIDWAGPVLITVALIYFVWGVLKYITGGSDEKKRSEARQTMIYGVIGLFVIVSVWGLVWLVQGFVGINPNVGPPVVPIPIISG